MKHLCIVLTFILITISSNMMAKEVQQTDVLERAVDESELKVSYNLSFPNPHTHYVEVEMKIENINQDVLDLKMAVWTPGSYLIREFPKNIDSFEVLNNGKTISHKKISKNTWQINSKGINSLTVNYKVYCFELSVRTSFVDEDKAYLNGTSIFMFPDKGIGLSSTVNIEPHPEWKEISTSLKTSGSKWTRSATDYDILFDAPILIGNQQIFEFTAQGIPHYLAIDGIGNYDPEQMQKDIVKIIDTETELFGENPCDEYTFLLLSTEKSFGGLEHLNSTSLIYPRWNFQPYSSYVRYMSLVAHEYFHLWNVKRIRPAALGPFDYETENYTNLLWVAEGFTSYYDEYLLTRAGFITSKEYFPMIESVFNYCENTPGRKVQSLADASFDAWIKYYRKNENSDNCCVSYYQKGAGVAVLLDLAIRNETNGDKSLDDVMRYMYKKFYKEEGRGFTDEEMQETILEVVGIPCTEFFTNYIHGTDDLDYDKYLGFAGLKLEDKNEDNKKTYLGVKTKPNDDGQLIITSVDSEGAAYEAGLNVNDEIIAVNGFRINSDNFGKFIKMNEPGDEVEFMVSRAGMVRKYKVKLTNSPKSKFKIVKLKDATKKQKGIFKGWLNEDF